MFNLLNSALGIVVIIIVFIGLCCLQIFLSKTIKKMKYWGLVLPASCFIISIAFLIPNIEVTFNTSFSTGAFFASLLAFIIMNVPTMIFLGIYLYFLKKAKKESQLEKMIIQDLE